MEAFEGEIIMAAIWIFGFIFVAIVFAPVKSKESEDDKLEQEQIDLVSEEVAA